MRNVSDVGDIEENLDKISQKAFAFRDIDYIWEINKD